MSMEASAELDDRKYSFNASSHYDLRNIHAITKSPMPDVMHCQLSNIERQLTEMNQYIQGLNVRISYLERNPENENSSIYSSQYKYLMRSEVSGLDKKGGSNDLSGTLLHLQSELNSTNNRMRNIEDLCRQNNPSHLNFLKHIPDRPCMRILLKAEMDAIIEESVRCVIENNYQMKQILERSASAKTRNISQSQTNIRRCSQFSAQSSRANSREGSQEFKFPPELSEKGKRHPDAVTSDKNACLGQRNDKTDRPEPSLDARLHGNTRETKVCEVGPFKESTDDNPLKHIDNAVPPEAGKNVASRIESPFSSKKFNQQPSIDSRVEEDECGNTFQKMQQATNRVFCQQVSIESKLESDEFDKNRYMHPATGSSNRTLDTQVSLEGMLELDESENNTELYPATSIRTLNQQISLEGRLEEEAGEDVVAEKRPLSSSRSLNTQMSIEGMLEEASISSAATEIQPGVSAKTGNAKQICEAGKRKSNKSNTLGNQYRSRGDSRPKSAGVKFWKKHDKHT